MAQAKQSTVERHLSRRFQVSLVFEGALVGLLAGGVITLYRIALSWGERTLRGLLAFIQGNYLGILGLVALLVFAMLAVGALMMWEPNTVGSGIPQVDAEVAGRLDMPWQRVLAAKFAEGTLLSLTGLSLGREGPSVQLGGVSGKAISRLMHKGRGEEHILITCGAASGMSAAFQAPLTGVMFALEEIHKVFTAPLVISVMVSSVMADYVTSRVLGLAPVLSLNYATDLPLGAYPLVILMGIVMGVLGAAHNQGMFLIQDLMGHIKGKTPYPKLAVAFVLTGVAALTAPVLLCGGDAIAEILLSNELEPLGFVLAVLVGKYLLTAICFGSGAPGGTLFPLVMLGGLAGCAFGIITTRTCGIAPMYVTNFMILGITGLFAGAIRAPLTGIVMVFELTRSMDSLLAASVVAVFAYVTANVLNVDPYYEHLFARLIGVDTADEKITHAHSHRKIIHTHMVEATSPLEGKRISEVQWPEHSLVVTVTRAGVEIVPRGYTRIQALDRIMVIMDVENEYETEQALRTMCHAPLGEVGDR